MKLAIFGGLLALAGFSTSLQAQTYQYDAVNRQFIQIAPQASVGTTTTTSGYYQGQPGYYQSQPTSVVQAAAQQLLPQYFGNTTTYYPNSGYGYNNGYNGQYYGNSYGNYGTGYGNSYGNYGSYGNRSNGRGWRR